MQQAFLRRYKYLVRGNGPHCRCDFIIGLGYYCLCFGATVESQLDIEYGYKICNYVLSVSPRSNQRVNNLGIVW